MISSSFAKPKAADLASEDTQPQRKKQKQTQTTDSSSETKYTDNTFQTMDKIGMAGKIFDRYKFPQERESLFLLCSLGWVPVEARKPIVKSQKTLIENIIANQDTPEELKAYLSMFHGRQAADLGLRSNLYRQQIECSHQLLYHQDVPAEFLSCDVEGINDDRKLVVHCANLGLSVLRKLLVDDNGNLLQVKHIHCTLSWNTGAQEDRLSSKRVATNYMSDNAPWEDPLPDAAIPGAKTAEQIFSTDYNDHQVANGKAMVSGRLQKGAKEFVLELLDTNDYLFSKKNQLENLLRCNNYTHHLEILGEIKVWVHNVTKSTVIVHPPLSICMDCRLFVPKQLGKRRFQLLEIVRLMVTSLKTGREQVTLQDLPKTKDAIFASYVYEATIDNFHQDRRVACALARDVLTDDSINACVQNGLDKASEEVFIYHRGHMKEKKAQEDAGLAQRGSKKGVAGRWNDFYRLVWAANRTSFLDVDKRQIQQSMMVGGIDPDATITQVCVEVDAILRGSKNNIAKLANWSNFEKERIRGYIKEQFIAIRSKTLKNNSGNKLPRKAFNKQQNDALVSNLVQGQSLCWVRAGTPTDNEAKLIPDFATISIEYAEKWPKVPNTPKTVAFFVDSTQFVVAGLKRRALNSKGRFELVKMRKIFVDGKMDENDKPNVWVVKQGGPKSLQPRGGSLGMTWMLCQLQYTAAQKGKFDE